MWFVMKETQESALQNEKPNFHICKDRNSAQDTGIMQVPKIPLNHCHKLSRQLAASAQQVHKRSPCKNEPQPCIRRLFSRLNQIFRSSSKETLDLLTCEHRMKEQIRLVC